MFQEFTSAKFFNWASGLVIIVSSLLLLFNPALMPANFSDISFHLSAAQGFNRAGGLVTWDFWEAAPTGRPFIYPPAFQIFLSFLLTLGLPPLLIIKLVSFLIYPLALFLVWSSAKKLFKPLVAFLATIFLAHSFFFMVLATTTVPGTLVVALTPLALVFLERKKYWSVFFLLVIFWYSHMILPYFSVLALLAFGWFNQRQEFKKIILVVFGSYLVFLPWLFWILINLDYLKYLSVPSPFETGNSDAAFDLIIPFLSGLGLLVSFIWWREERLVQKLLPFLVWAFSMLIFIPYYPERFFNNAGLVPLVIFLAVFFYLILAKISHFWTKIGIGALLFILFLVEILLVHLPEQKPTLKLVPAAWPLLIRYAWAEQPDKNLGPYTAGNLKLAQTIMAQSQVDDIFWSTTSVFEHLSYTPGTQVIIANFFGSLTGRAVANARLPEFFSPALWQPLPINQAKLVLAELKQTPFWSGQRSVEEQKISEILASDFELIGQNEILYLYKNKSSQVTKVVPVKPVVPSWLAYLILLGLILGAFVPSGWLRKYRIFFKT